MHIIVWRYTVLPADREVFEKEYGYGGSWAHFFRRSPQFLGSRLYKDEEDKYLLIDAWGSKASYREFLDANREEYQQLSDRFAYLYQRENPLGEFLEVQPPYDA